MAQKVQICACMCFMMIGACADFAWGLWMEHGNVNVLTAYIGFHDGAWSEYSRMRRAYYKKPWHHMVCFFAGMLMQMTVFTYHSSHVPPSDAQTSGNHDSSAVSHYPKDSQAGKKEDTKGFHSPRWADVAAALMAIFCFGYNTVYQVGLISWRPLSTGETQN